jgi:glycosyltransferase involved in cell wall biosynthesis
MCARAADPPRRTVLHIIDTLSHAGAQRYVVLLCQWSSPQLYRHIVCVLQPGTELRPQLESAGIRVVCLNMPRPGIVRPWRFMRYGMRAVRAIMGLCRSEGVDVVQCHLSDAEFLGITAAALSRTPVIITTLHGPQMLPNRPWWSGRSMLRRIVTRLLYCCVDHIVAVSAEVAEQAHRQLRAPLSKITTIINRIDTDSYAASTDTTAVKKSLGLGPHSRAITTVARLELLKGHTCLLSALAMLAKHRGDVYLLLLGDGSCHVQLEAQCRASGLEGRVQFLGTRDDVRQILGASDIFAFPSFAEGTSLALMEAMASGLPIVASDIPGNRTLLEHGENALLVPPGDTAALASALGRLLDNPAQAQALGAEARAFVREHFDIRATVSALEQLWQCRTQ